MSNPRNIEQIAI